MSVFLCLVAHHTDLPPRIERKEKEKYVSPIPVDFDVERAVRESRIAPIYSVLLDFG